jgi:hypothetical protein
MNSLQGAGDPILRMEINVVPNKQNRQVVDLEISEKLSTKQRNKVARRRIRRSAKKNLQKLNIQAAPYGPGRLSKKQIRRLTAQGINLNRKWNLYEQMLVNPFTGPVVQYPDEYAGPTRVQRILTQRKLAFSAAGIASGRVYTDISNHLELDGQTSASSLFGPRYVNSTPSSSTGSLWYVYAQGPAKAMAPPVPDSIGRFAPPVQEKFSITPEGTGTVPSGNYGTSGSTAQFFFQDGSTFDSSHGVVTLNQYPVTTSGSTATYQGIPFAANDTIAVRAVTQDTTANNFNIFGFFITESAGVYSAVTTAATGNPLTGGGIATGYVGATVTAPANTVAIYGYSVVNAGVGTAASLNAVVTSGLTRALDIARYPAGKQDGSDIALLKKDAENSRTIAMGAWWENRTNTLLREGDVVVGQVPMTHSENLPPPSIDNYTCIPGFYAGQLKKGAYCWWRPLDMASMKFVCIATENTDFDPDSTPKFAFFLSVSTTNAAAQNIVLKTAVIVEAQTDSQVLGALPSPVDPPMIWDAAKHLAYLPNAMSNDDHSKFLKELLSSTVGTALSAAGSWVLETGLPMVGAAIADYGAYVGAGMLGGLIGMAA